LEKKKRKEKEEGNPNQPNNPTRRPNPLPPSLFSPRPSPLPPRPSSLCARPSRVTRAPPPLLAQRATPHSAAQRAHPRSLTARPHLSALSPSLPFLLPRVRTPLLTRPHPARSVPALWTAPLRRPTGQPYPRPIPLEASTTEPGITRSGCSRSAFTALRPRSSPAFLLGARTPRPEPYL
jgi:hypothetical protein